jgi:signal transduction histidine kinase
MSLVLFLLVLGLVVRVVVLQRRLELVARAEHELRAPLTSLMLALPRAARLDGELARVQAGLADLAAARCGSRAAPRPMDVALERMAGRVAAGWSGRSGRRVTVDWQAGSTMVHADPGRLSQALGNLVANAVEHGGGEVVLSGRLVKGGEAVRVEVRDAGPGLPGGRRFGRIRTGLWRHRASARGRGLAIAAAAARDAGGSLDAGNGPPAIEVPMEKQS